jgi:hypothetical protein
MYRMCVCFGHKDKKVERLATRLGMSLSHCSLVVDSGSSTVEYEYTTRGVVAVSDAHAQPPWHSSVVFLSSLWEPNQVLSSVIDINENWPPPSVANVLAVSRQVSKGYSCHRFIAEALKLPYTPMVGSPVMLRRMLGTRGVLVLQTRDRFIPPSQFGLEDLAQPFGFLHYAAKHHKPQEYDDGLGTWATTQARWVIPYKAEGLLCHLPSQVVVPVVTAAAGTMRDVDINQLLRDWYRQRPVMSDIDDPSLRRLQVEVNYLPYAAEAPYVQA